MPSRWEGSRSRMEPLERFPGARIIYRLGSVVEARNSGKGIADLLRAIGESVQVVTGL